jgi:hypothetical protein
MRGKTRQTRGKPYRLLQQTGDAREVIARHTDHEPRTEKPRHSGRSRASSQPSTGRISCAVAMGIGRRLGPWTPWTHGRSRGHIEDLKGSSELGDILVVGVDSNWVYQSLSITPKTLSPWRLPDVLTIGWWPRRAQVYGSVPLCGQGGRSWECRAGSARLHHSSGHP